MGMNKCKKCGEEVSKDAIACPKCGKDQRNFFKKHPVWCTIGIIVILGIVIGAGGSSEETPKNTLNSTTNTELENSIEDNVQTSTSTQQKLEYKVGETYEDEYIAIKYVSRNLNFTKYSKYADVKKGYKVIQATFEFQNVGTADEYVYSGEFNCYADGYDCETFYSVEDSSFSATLSSEKKTKGNVYFEVPKNAKEITIEYEVNAWTSEKVVFVVK